LAGRRGYVAGHQRHTRIQQKAFQQFADSLEARLRTGRWHYMREQACLPVLRAWCGVAELFQATIDQQQIARQRRVGQVGVLRASRWTAAQVYESAGILHGIVKTDDEGTVEERIEYRVVERDFEVVGLDTGTAGLGKLAHGRMLSDCGRYGRARVAVPVLAGRA